MYDWNIRRPRHSDTYYFFAGLLAVLSTLLLASGAVLAVCAIIAILILSVMVIVWAFQVNFVVGLLALICFEVMPIIVVFSLLAYR